MVLEKMATGGSRVAQVTAEEHLQLLAAALSLHLGSERVVTSVFRMIDRLPSFDLVTPTLCLAMGEAYKRHMSLVVIFRPLMERIEQHARDFSKFDMLFGKAVNAERLVYSCNVLVNSPLWSATTLHVTKSFLCIGRQVLPLSELRKVVPYRSLLRPALNLVFVATMDDYDLVVLSRQELLEQLKKLGLSRIIEAEKS